MAEPQAKSVVQSVERALDLLVLLRRAKRPLTLSELAADSKLPFSTVYRLLGALQGRGFVAHVEGGKGYQLGPEAVSLGTSDRLKRDVVHVAAEHAAALSFELQESVNVVIRDGLQGIIALKAEPSQPLRHTVPLGTAMPLHCTAAGKVLLAFSGDEGVVQNLFDNNLMRSYTGNTIVTVRELRDELKRIRERGYSFDNEEHVPGLRCVGAPVLLAGGEAVAALSVAGPVSRMNEKIERVVTGLRVAAEAVARVLAT